MNKKVSLVIVPIDDFTDEIITKKQVNIKVNDIKRNIIRKQEGFLIITDLQEEIVKLSISAYSFAEVKLNVNIKELDSLNPVIKVRLKPMEKYNFKAETTCIKGNSKADSELLIINMNKKNTFRLLEDIRAEAKSILIYNPLNINLADSKILIKDNTEKHAFNEVLDFDSKSERYILKADVSKEFKRENSKVIKAEILRTDEEGNFFMALKNGLNKDNIIFIKMKEDIFHTVKLERGKINTIDLNHKEEE